MDQHIDIGKAIYNELQRQECGVSWLANKLNISRMACYRMFNSYSIDTELLYRVSKVLDYDFFALYSANLKCKIQD